MISPYVHYQLLFWKQSQILRVGRNEEKLLEVKWMDPTVCQQTDSNSFGTITKQNLLPGVRLHNTRRMHPYQLWRRIVTHWFLAPYKYSYLLTYLLTGVCMCILTDDWLYRILRAFMCDIAGEGELDCQTRRSIHSQGLFPNSSLDSLNGHSRGLRPRMCNPQRQFLYPPLVTYYVCDRREVSLITDQKCYEDTELNCLQYIPEQKEFYALIRLLRELRIKIALTRGSIFNPKCTKYRLAAGLRPNPLGSLCAPRSLSRVWPEKKWE